MERIVEAPVPRDVLLTALEELGATQDITTQAAIFESVLSRVDVRHFWVLYRMTHVYAELGRDDAAFFAAAQAVQMEPGGDAAHSLFHTLFRGFVRRGDARGAVDVFLRHVGYHPEKPIAERHEVEPLLRELGIDPQIGPPQPQAADVALRVTHRVTDAEPRPAAPVRALARRAAAWAGAAIRADDARRDRRGRAGRG